MRDGVGVAVGVVVSALATRRDPQALVHGDKGHEADQDGDAEQQVAVRLDQYEVDAVRAVLAEEDLGQEVEEGVTEQAADGEGDHDGQGRWVDVGRAQSQQEVGRARDVEGREEGVDGRAAGEEDAEQLGQARGTGVRVGGGLGGVEVLDDGALL